MRILAAVAAFVVAVVALVILLFAPGTPDRISEAGQGAKAEPKQTGALGPNGETKEERKPDAERVRQRAANRLDDDPAQGVLRDGLAAAKSLLAPTDTITSQSAECVAGQCMVVLELELDPEADLPEALRSMMDEQDLPARRFGPSERMKMVGPLLGAATSKNTPTPASWAAEGFSAEDPTHGRIVVSFASEKPDLR